ncbi:MULTISPECIES: F0F1 ATP synthase subunit B' [unclassified Hwanghaeella]|jgi:F-type H+-transporting ATPase subunit b|uniref:F0F1 ATP synthase subunit B family protein n=1 Tax=unclassified Hwanghaeella TaxID=2605944 RepID=UPI000C8CC8B1|nr:F0F1 ATP synthase subunit B' [Rhodospirillales bacterium]|tara:strand:- start:11199 stop:11792 length:594 start_codon:yes stop_codon:yes gene_type:complete
MNQVLKSGLQLSAVAVISVIGPVCAYAAEAEHQGGMPQLDTSSFSSQIFWLAVTFAALFILMWKVAVPRVGDVIESREQKIRADLERAEQLRVEIAEAEASVEKALSEARSEAQDILRKAQEKLVADHAKKMEKLDADLAVKMTDAEASIDEARKEAMASIREVAQEVAAASIEKLSGKAASKADVTKAVDAAAKGV